MMKKVWTALLGVCFIPLFSNAQFWEVGILLGGSNYSGDLSPAPVMLNETHGTIGAFIRANVNKTLTIKGNVYYGAISGADANSEKKNTKLRNLSFYSTLLDIGANAEINILGFMPGKREYRTSPYAFLGLSVFKFDPQAIDPIKGEWVRLQPLGTEGQGTTRYNDRKKYALAQVSIPFGVGVKHALNDNWNIGLEIGVRKTFTDYLDDVSTTYVEYGYLETNSSPLAARMSNRTEEIAGIRKEYGPETSRGNPTNDDWYMIAGVTLSYVIMPRYCYRF